jgi:hypothetical protein
VLTEKDKRISKYVPDKLQRVLAAIQLGVLYLTVFYIKATD